MKTEEFWRQTIERQFNASMDMFEKALRTCPEEVWTASMWSDPVMPPGFSEFWYVAYHALFWLDLYLGGSVEGFVPPAPFTLDELNPDGVLPGRVYTRDELLVYLGYSRRKLAEVMGGLTPHLAERRCKFGWGEVSFGELLIDNLRHMQEHGSQLNMMLGQKKGLDPGWVSGAVK